jgi:hypothetical protein
VTSSIFLPFGNNMLYFARTRCNLHQDQGLIDSDGCSVEFANYLPYRLIRSIRRVGWKYGAGQCRQVRPLRESVATGIARSRFLPPQSGEGPGSAGGTLRR